jgi:16S rRNA (uracil1498-N3)-methyltransferase
MNLILLSDSDFITPHRVRLSDRRMVHIRDILKAECAQSLTVGRINGLMGQGTVVSKKTDYLELEVKLDQKPPEALALTLILALPRPPMLKRILFSAAMLGIKKIIILNFNRVEKSLWNSSSLKPQAITEQLVLGLEQAKDTIMPEVILKKGFKPFVEDELPVLIKGKLALVAHPGGDSVIPVFPNVIPNKSVIPAKAGIHNQPITLIIGPEGGIIDYEIDLLKAAGCQLIDLGPRILRTESVLPYVVGKLF